MKTRTTVLTPDTTQKAGSSLIYRLAMLAAIGAYLTACATAPKVSTQAKPGADFTHYHTFALMPLATTGPASDPGLMLRVGEPARQAVVEALTAKGLSQAGLTNADIAVNLRGDFVQKLEVTDWGYQTVPRRWGAYQGNSTVTAKNYEERTLSIEVFDNHSKDVAWIGWTKTAGLGEIQTERVQEAVRNVLAKFPAGSPAPAVK